jgi:SOS-response transcriptional repressor LexA
LPWGNILSADPLPERFDVKMPDESMMPRVRPGDLLTFSTDKVPRPGDGVLVRDAAGGLYFRQYRERRAGQWTAHPLNDAFQPLDSAADQLTILAVLVGIPEQRWS